MLIKRLILPAGSARKNRLFSLRNSAWSPKFCSNSARCPPNFRPFDFFLVRLLLDFEVPFKILSKSRHRVCSNSDYRSVKFEVRSINVLKNTVCFKNFGWWRAGASKKTETNVVQVYKMKRVLEVIFRVKLNGTKTVFFNPYDFDESVHEIRTQINLSRFSLPACAF